VTVPLMVSGTARTPGNYTHHAWPGGDQGGCEERFDHGAGCCHGLNEDDKTVVVSMGCRSTGTGEDRDEQVTIVNTDPEPTVSFGSAISSGESGSAPAVWK